MTAGPGEWPMCVPGQIAEVETRHAFNNGLGSENLSTRCGKERMRFPILRIRTIP
jgi:hypothetical protein